MNNFIPEFQKIVKTHPDNFAIIENSTQKITYQELWNYAETIANQLQNTGVQPQQIIAINIEKSIDYVASILGIWMIDAVFLPLAPSLPTDRKEFILEDSQADFISTPELIFSTQNSSSKLIPESESNPPAYLIYTSGSTGKPKGVLVGHRGIVNILKQQIQLCNITSETRSLFMLSTSFDASISDIGIILLSGGCLYIEDINAQDLILQLPQIIKKNNITYIDIPPSVLALLDIEQIPDSLETLLIGGELANINVVRKWANKLKLINVYGPTEATICTSMVICDRYFVEGDIGKLVQGIKYKISDQGELLIGGIGLAIGYWNNRKLNQEKFIILDGERFYKTGDLVEFQDGKYIFKGRIDRQVKIRGQLVELEEVENTIKSNPYINNAAVIVVSKGSKKQLIAFVQGKSNLDIKFLEEYIGNKITSWMIPSSFILLDSLPTNVNGKIDYSKLQEYYSKENDSNIQDRGVSNQSQSQVQIQSNSQISKLENKLIQIWREILDIEEINLDDDFYQLGGDSLSTIEMITKASNIGINLPISVVAKEKTIRNILKYHSKKENGTDGVSVADLETKIKKLSNINISKTNPIEVEGSNTAFLLTGGTGFLGIRLLKNLLKLYPKSSYYLLLRGENSIVAQDRLITIAEEQGIKFTQNELGRIYILCGNIGLPKLGLLDEVWELLLNNITDIVHLAAEVNMIKTYEQLEQTNVLGTREIIKLALTCKKKNIHYASTLSVFVATDQNTGTVYENDDLSNIKTVYGGYAQTKFVAEKLLHKFKDNLNINIFRYGLLTGDSTTGQYANHDFLSMFVKGIISIGKLPKGDYNQLFLDVTPIDYAYKVTGELIKNSKFQTFHIANTQGFSLTQILTGLENLGIHIELLDSSDWLDFVKKMDLSPEQSATVMGLCRLLPDGADFNRLRSMDLFQGTDIVFDMVNTLDLVGNINIIKADDILLDLYLKRILEI